MGSMFATVGVPSLQRRLNDLGDRGAKRATQKSVRKGAAPIRAAARAGAPQGRTKRFKRSIRTVTRTRKGQASAIVRARGGADGSRAAGFIEFGTKARFRKVRLGRRIAARLTGRGQPGSTGTMPALAPMRRAVQRAGRQGLTAATEELERQIVAEAGRG